MGCGGGEEACNVYYPLLMFSGDEWRNVRIVT